MMTIFRTENSAIALRMFRVQSVIRFGGEIGAAKGLSLARGAERVLIMAEIGWDSLDLGENVDRRSFSLVGVPISWLDSFDAHDETRVLRTLDDIELWACLAEGLGVPCEGRHFVAY
jgi:hypothetical protein